MTFLDRWVRRPQSCWLRKALFQVHLWAGMGAGLYVLLISVTGSLLVFRPELHRVFESGPVIIAGLGERLNPDALKEAARRSYPEYRLTEVWNGKNPDQAVEIWFERDGERKARLFDPYTGTDLGEPMPASIRFSLWLVDLHDNLLYGETGRIVNGVGALFLTSLCLTGTVIWWPGIKTWRRSLIIEWRANWKRLNWTLHSAMGFWAFAFVFMWAISGVYLVFQEPFAAAVDYFEPPGEFEQERLGDIVLRWLARVHFGRFAGWPVKVVWLILGLVPVLLFVTGALMWWNRVLRPGAQNGALIRGQGMSGDGMF